MWVRTLSGSLHVRTGLWCVSGYVAGAESHRMASTMDHAVSCVVAVSSLAGRGVFPGSLQRRVAVTS